MAKWEKVVIASDKLSALANVDSSSVASPDQNETLIFDGTDWQAAAPGTEYNFSISYFASPDSIVGSKLQGDESTTWKENVNFSANYNNLSGNLDSNASVGISGDTGSGQAGFPYDMGADGSGGGTVTLKYPVADWSAVFNKTTYTLTAIEGGVGDAATLDTYFYNYKAWGIDASATLDTTGTESGDVFGLHTISGNSTTFAGEIPIALQSGGSSLDGTGYIHYCYPARLTGTPTFWISGLEVGFTLVSSILSVTNTAGYAELFKHYRSPQSYTSASNTFQVT